MAHNGEDDRVTGPTDSVYRRRRIVALSVALLLTAAVAVGVVVATADKDDEPDRRAAPSATATPDAAPTSAETSPSAEDSASPSPEPSPSVEPSPTPTPTPSASATRATRTSSPTASPRRAYPPKGLVLEVTGEPITGDPPQVRFRIRVRDNDASGVNGTINFGDGTSLVYAQRPQALCESTPSEPPPGYRAQPIDKTYTVTHTYERGGQFTVTVTANTERQCHGAPVENARQTLIVVVPPRQTTSPRPTTSPSPISTPLPTASPSTSPSATPSPSRT